MMNRVHGCLLTLKKKSKRLSNLSSQFHPIINTTNKKLNNENQNLRTKGGIADLRDENSAFHTKATSNIHMQSDANLFNIRQSDFNIQPINEMFDEENKENRQRESNTARHEKSNKSRILSIYKSTAPNNIISDWIADGFASLDKDKENNSVVIQKEEDNKEGDFEFSMTNSASKRLEILKESLESDQYFSTTLSIDPKTLDECVTSKQFPLERREHQWDCGESQLKNLKWWIRMQQWLSSCFLSDTEEFGFNPKDSEDYNKLIEFFHSEKYNKKIDHNSQLIKDINRTYQEIKYFQQGNKGYEDLKELLTKFISHPIAKDTGYVQGMNFIAANLLYHSQVDVAFCLFIQMMIKYDLIKNYEPGMPGVTSHWEVIDKMVFKHLRTLQTYFHEQAIPIQMYSIELICSLFGSKIPVQKMMLFYDKFFIKGWKFFYALVNFFNFVS